MELKLVYRGLRQFSDWALRYYSDIYVDGVENVPREGPLIITPCHHNEILDVATLSVVIPHGRPVCFWGKSTLFQFPVLRQIFLSSGAIPVARNPNSVPPEGAGSSGVAASPQRNANDALFRDTFKALERGEVICVFPEGTSYTEPGIAQVKEGAARAALEYVRWARENRGGQEEGRRLKIVPVGIVYTDKSQFQTGVRVRWGTPIDAEDFASEFGAGQEGEKNEVSSRDTVKALTSEIEKKMLALTINAPDWDTLYTVEIAREILWSTEDLRAANWVWISQNLISLFSDTNAAPSQGKARQALLKYRALLTYANVSHSSLNAILPDINSRPRPARALWFVLRETALTFLHPRFALFLPVLLLHIPAYVAGLLADRLLSTPGEDETRAQFKAVFGGLVATATYAALARAIVRGLVTNSAGPLGWLRSKVPRLLAPVFGLVWKAGRWFFTENEGHLGEAKSVAGVFGVFYLTSFFLSRWHSYWVKSNYVQFKRLLASFKILLGSITPKPFILSGGALAPYTTNPVPPPNPFIRRRAGHEPSTEVPYARSVSAARLVHPLLDARADATRAMWSFLVDSKYLHGLVTARMRGEAWMQVGPAKRHGDIA